MDNLDYWEGEFRRRRALIQQFDYEAAKEFYSTKIDMIFDACDQIEQIKLEANEKVYNTILPSGERPRRRFYRIPSNN